MEDHTYRASDGASDESLPGRGVDSRRFTCRAKPAGLGQEDDTHAKLVDGERQGGVEA